MPYCLIAIYFSFDFASISFIDNEHSESATGLPYRWVPKGIIFIGLVLLLVGGNSVLMRVIVYLFGPERARSEPAAGAVPTDEPAMEWIAHHLWR